LRLSGARIHSTFSPTAQVNQHLIASASSACSAAREITPVPSVSILAFVMKRSLHDSSYHYLSAPHQNDNEKSTEQLPSASISWVCLIVPINEHHPTEHDRQEHRSNKAPQMGKCMFIYLEAKEEQNSEELGESQQAKQQKKTPKCP
jgi:hypothetical protein